MPSADIILKNARVITMDERRPAAEAVAVTGNTVSVVGDASLVESAKGVGTRVIDCRGGTLVPGFNDAHLHLFSLVRQLLSLDLSPPKIKSIADIKEAIHRQAAGTPPGTWLSGTGFNDFYLEEKRYPTRWDLDEAAPDHPVVISHRSLHACVLNSRALELAGIGMETPEPPGARIERDIATGEPNGILFEMLGYIHNRVMGPFTAEELEQGVNLADGLFLYNGITSLQEATVVNDTGRWEAICSLVLNCQLHSRVSMMAGSSHWREFREHNLRTGSGDDLMRLGAVKFVPGVRDSGVYPPQDELNEMALECHDAGWQLAFHAVDESTVNAALTALEYIGGHSSVAGRRHRIEHCGECPDAMLERIRQLGAVIVTQPPFIYYSGERYLSTVSPSQLTYLYRMKSPLEHGIVVAASSDTPVVPLNPLMGIYAAVTRTAETGQELLPEEAVTPEQALSMYTINAAYASFEEDIKGSITPGKLADLVLLSENPLIVPPEKIKDIKVIMTIIGGEVVREV